MMSICTRSVRLFHSTPFRFKITPFLLADIGEGITECEVIQWFVKAGDRVAQFDKICEVQSDKAAVEITSRFDGVITALHCDQGAMARVGKPLVDIDIPDESGENVPAEPVSAKEKVEKKIAAPQVSSVKSESSDLLTFATPAVRRIAKENNIRLSEVVGTGRDGRILKEDVLAFIENGGKSSQPAASPAAATPVASVTSAPAVSTFEKVPLTPIQKAMFKSMTKSLQIPHFGFSEEINMNACKNMRDVVNSMLKKSKHGQVEKLTYMPIMMKAMSLALTKYPILNACIVEEAGVAPMLQYRSAHNIGIAMDTPNGLVVPNVKNVEQKSIFEIAEELERLKQMGQKGALTTSDLTGGTITLSNIGNVGGTVLHPVLVSTEVCIGAVGRIQKLPRYVTIKDEQGHKREVVEPQHIMHVSWNADHRVIDGATVARFVTEWKHYLEQPVSMMVHLK